MKELLLQPPAQGRAALGRCAAAAVLLIIAAYPDIIFCGASLSNANIANITGSPTPHAIELFPERQGREPYHGYHDPGGAIFQSEPGAQFMRRALLAGQSIYWNPYSATGSYGIETLVDVKVSPLSIATALLGGSDLVFHLAYLGLSLLAVFCLLLLLVVEFRLSLLAAITGGITYLLNGYFVANLASNVSQTWLYFPIFALGLVSFARHPRVSAFLASTIGAILVLATTFLPTTIMAMGTTLLVGAAAAIAFPITQYDNIRRVIRRGLLTVAGQIAAVVLALIALSIVYLPIFESMEYMHSSAFYAGRTFYPATLFNFISFFTPKHAFETYRAISSRAEQLRGNVAFHQGIVGFLLVAQAIRTWPTFQATLVAVMSATLVALVARVYGVPVVSQLADLLPLIGHLGQQYIWIGIAILFTMLVPFGIEAVLRRGVNHWQLSLSAVMIIGSLAYTTYLYGIDSEYAFRNIALVVVLTGIAGFILLGQHWVNSPLWPGVLLAVLSWAELTYYIDHHRLSRTERFLKPPAFVQFLQHQAGLYRVASYGQPGMPPEYGSAYGVQQIGSLNFQLFPYYEDLFNRLILPDPDRRWRSFVTLVLALDTNALNLPGFNLVGTRFLILPSAFLGLREFVQRSGWRRSYQDNLVLIFENPNPLPRAFVVHRLLQSGLTPIDVGQPARATVTSDDAGLVAEARRLGLTDKDWHTGPSNDDHATVTRYEHARVKIIATLSTPGILVLNDAWHPNWSVSVDGMRAHLGIVNEAFRGVALPAGDHVVEMIYSPKTLDAARGLSFLGLALMLGLWIARRRVDQFCRSGKRTRPARGTPEIVIHSLS